MVKNLKRSSILIAALLIFLYAVLSAQYQREIKKDAPPITGHYIRMSSFESLSTWSIAALREEPYISELFADGYNNVHFAYYDNLLNTAVYVTGKEGNFSRTILDNNRELGNLISIATNNSHIHVSYNKANKILYANDNSGTFNNYFMDLRQNRKILDLKLVMSAFNYPTLFFVDNRGTLSVSRFYRDNFFSDFVYTNRIIDNVYPAAEKDGYALYMHEYDTGNIFYGSRKTNTSFRFFDNRAIVTNASIYSVKHEEHNRFHIVYLSKDNNRNINYTRFYDGTFTNFTIVSEDADIISLDCSLDYASQIMVLYTKEDGNKYLFIDGRIIDLSVLGTSSGNVRLIAAQYPYYYLLYYNNIFDELRITKLNISDIEKLK
ncbi:hypothetical protein [Brachyspira murdochii]|uniref:DUF5050 domain-containing protein n=1 Tax=Brachyspira murdochii (strain ATCC 51284 / DSM 12563 / 56-150) TaxID=526224 RepID=D5U4H2_BRAM5|nr:hypothetical protein [Brachyspira murdochii]ADG70217.1 conserved hypothetical protein [Brachyspira murdochii DSM 12563]